MNDINWQTYRSAIQIDPQWKKRSKAAIVAFAKRESNQKETVYSGVSSKFWPKYAAALFALLILILVPRTIAAANDSRPGQFLYPFKLLGEKVRYASASEEMKPQVKVTVTVERTVELESSVAHDPEEFQMEAVEQVEKAREDIELLREDIRKDTYKKVKERLTKIKESAKHERVKIRLEEIITSLDERLGIELEENEEDENKSTPTPTPKPNQSGSGNAKSEIHVETNNGYTQVTINGTVVVSLAPTRDDSEIEVNVHGGSVKVKTKTNHKNESLIDVETDD